MKLFCILEQGQYVGDQLTVEHQMQFTTEFSDFFRLNWSTDEDPAAFVYAKDTTWSEGRSLLWEHVPKEYEYYIFIDDDIKFHHEDPALVIKKELAKYRPLSGTFYRRRYDVGTFPPSLMEKQKIEKKECWPICGYDLDTMIFHRSVAPHLLPVIYHGSGGSLKYAQYLCHLLYPSKQLVLANVIVENTRSGKHCDTGLPQYERCQQLYSRFIGGLKGDEHNLRLLINWKAILRKNRELYDGGAIDMRERDFDPSRLAEIYDVQNPDYVNRVAKVDLKTHLT